MTEEEKKAAEAAEFEASLEGLSEDEKAQKTAEREALLKNNTDIEEALKIERQKREEAERELAERDKKAKAAFEERERKRKEAGEDEEKPLTKGEFLSLLEQEREKDRKISQEDKARQIANSLTENTKEAELIIEVWRNRKLFGSLENQMREAKAIALASRTEAQNEELKRALGSKGTEKNDGLNSQRKPPLAGEPKLDENDKTVLQGFTWDGTKYKKTIAGGKKILFVSRDLKKRWIEDAKK